MDAYTLTSAAPITIHYQTRLWLPDVRSATGGIVYDLAPSATDADCRDYLMNAENQLDGYKTKLLELRERLIRALGVDTVNLLVERSLEEVVTVYPGLAAVVREGDDIVLDGLDLTYADASEADVRDAFSALYAVMLVMLGRMLGKEIALRLAGSPEARRVFEGDALAPR